MSAAYRLLNKFHKYKSLYLEGMNEVNIHTLTTAIEEIKKAKMVYVGGNGGSAAISNHLCCDFMKGANLKVISVSCNTPLITAIANDISYEETLSYQLGKLITKEDVCILISSSGNSPNIVNAARLVKSTGAKVIGLSGFSGGKLKEIADISLHVPINNYGVVEDCHQSIMHIISQYIGEEHVNIGSSTEAPGTNP